MTNDELMELWVAAKCGPSLFVPGAEMNRKWRDTVQQFPAQLGKAVDEIKRLRALVEAAYREGRDEDSPDHPDVDEAWAESDARKALEGA